MLVDFLNSCNVGIRKKWLITRMKNFPPLLNFVATLSCKTNTSVNVNNAVLLSDAKFKQNMTKKVTKS